MKYYYKHETQVQGNVYKGTRAFTALQEFVQNTFSAVQQDINTYNDNLNDPDQPQMVLKALKPGKKRYPIQDGSGSESTKAMLKYLRAKEKKDDELDMKTSKPAIEAGRPEMIKQRPLIWPPSE